MAHIKDTRVARRMFTQSAAWGHGRRQETLLLRDDIICAAGSAGR